MHKPRILISAYREIGKNESYMRAIEAAGGEPVCRCAPGADLAYDGLLLCGGDGPDAVQDGAALSLARAYIEYGKPVLGICRGAQLLNVALGGSLWQRLGHAGEGITHPVRARENSLLWDLYDADFTVNSCHLHALRLPGCGVLPTAWAQDGTVEGFEHERLPLLGVQWQPEGILHGEGGCAPGLPLFRYFLCLCQEGGAELHAPVQRDPDVRFACGVIDDE